jgi:4-hydroxymandelate oxidase
VAAGLAGTAGAVLGAAFSTPPSVAPTGYQRLAHPDGELATAAGAARAGAVFVLSTRSTCRIEDVAESVARHGGTWWFQVYLMRDRGLTEGLVSGRRRAPSARSCCLRTSPPACHGDPAAGVTRRRRGHTVEP